MMKKKIGILQFPGSLCEQDVYKALTLLNLHPELIDSRQSIERKSFIAFIVPGGFSYGDYLRPGALARFSPAIQDLIQATKKGWPVLGICNGFQILCEAGILPGVLLPNKHSRFIDKWLTLEVKNKSPFWPIEKSKIRLPIAHGEGRYYLDLPRLKKLQDKNQIWICYKDNPNGSSMDIAGVMNETGNAAGLMPHPERAVDPKLGRNTDGGYFFHFLK